MESTGLQQKENISSELLQEKSVIELCRNGDSNAFSAIVKKYQDRLYNTVYRLVNSPEDALDICQDVFLKAYQNIKSFRGDSSFLTYLYRIAFNESIAYRNKRQRIKASIGQKAKDLTNRENNSSSSAIHSKEQQQYIQDVLNSLEPELKEVIVLKDIEGFSYAGIAEALNISVSTVRTNLEKARQLLRLKLKELI